MKKYVKPDLFYENFELSRTVASCSSNSISKANFHSKSTCSIDLYGDRLFDGGSGCATTPDEVGFEDYCYQIGTASYNFFAS